MFSHILFATDGSDHSHKAVAHVSGVARLTKAKVPVLHAYHPLSDLESLLGEAEYERHSTTGSNEPGRS